VPGRGEVTTDRSEGKHWDWLFCDLLQWSVFEPKDSWEDGLSSTLSGWEPEFSLSPSTRHNLIPEGFSLEGEGGGFSMN
jgi:hypothetical protein